MLKGYITRIVEKYCTERVFSHLNPLEEFARETRKMIGPHDVDIGRLHRDLRDMREQLSHKEEHLEQLRNLVHSLEEKQTYHAKEQLDLREAWESRTKVHEEEFTKAISNVRKDCAKNVSYWTETFSRNLNKTFDNQLDQIKTDVLDLAKKLAACEECYDNIPDFSGPFDTLDKMSQDLQRIQKQVKKITLESDNIIAVATDRAVVAIESAIYEKKKLYVLIKEAFRKIFMDDVIREIMPQIKGPGGATQANYGKKKKR